MMKTQSPPPGDVRLCKFARISQALIVGATAVAFALPFPVAAGGLAVPSATPLSADFGNEKPSTNARELANWIADSRDNENADFIIVDKQNAKAYVFDAAARLRGASPVLLGAALGDDSVPGIGTRPIADVRPEERTTPAGRFVAESGSNLNGEDVVWVDYDTAVSMHRVRASKQSERRLERLATPTIDDNRISYGCINVPVKFYETFVRPIVATHPAIVYVLPDTKSLQEVFGLYNAKIRQHALNRQAGDTVKTIVKAR